MLERHRAYLFWVNRGRVLRCERHGNGCFGVKHPDDTTRRAYLATAGRDFFPARNDDCKVARKPSSRVGRMMVARKPSSRVGRMMVARKPSCRVGSNDGCKTGKQPCR